jgi:hypothetical protein
MGIAVHDKYLAREVERFLLQRAEELAIAAMGQALDKVLETGIGLEKQHDTGQLLAAGQGEAVMQPGQDYRVARLIFGGLRWSAPVVVAARAC